MQRVRIPRGGLYSRFNPPSSLEVASTRIDELNREIEYIENSIEFSGPKQGQSEQEYQTWVQKAVSALSYFKTERVYLVTWTTQNQPGSARTDGTYASSLAYIDTEVRNFLASEEAKYVELYSYSRPEPTKEQAISRRLELNKLMDYLEKKELHLKNLSDSKKIDMQDWRSIRKGIWDLKSKIKVEQRYLKPLARLANRSGPAVFLLGLLERAVSEGFKMTPEEESQFKALQ